MNKIFWTYATLVFVIYSPAILLGVVLGKAYSGFKLGLMVGDYIFDIPAKWIKKHRRN